MTIELLIERLKILNIQNQDAKDRLNQAIADLNTIDGAIQEVNYWINILNNQSKD